jgi:hypothetical protein
MEFILTIFREHTSSFGFSLQELVRWIDLAQVQNSSLQLFAIV